MLQEIFRGAEMSFLIKAFFQHMPPYPGAAAIRGISIIESLAKLTIVEDGRIEVFCGTFNPTKIDRVSLVTLNVSEIENSQSLKKRLIGELWMGYTSAKKMLFDGGRPTLIIVSSPGYISTLVQVMFAILLRVPYAIELRDIYPQAYADANIIQRRSLIYFLFRRLSRLMYTKAQLVLCATQGLGREVRREAPSSNVKCVYNGFPADFLDRQGVKHHKFTVCFHGVLGFFQDIETLIRVTEQLSRFDVNVIVIGYGRKAHLFENTKLNNLRFLGRQSFNSTIAEIERCHVGLCLRLDDSISRNAFPVKVWEYLGLGVPSIITPPSEAGEFLKLNGCGLVHDSGDIEGIIASILSLRADMNNLERMSYNCRQHAREYTREKTGLTAANEILKVVRRNYDKQNH